MYFELSGELELDFLPTTDAPELCVYCMCQCFEYTLIQFCFMSLTQVQ